MIRHFQLVQKGLVGHNYKQYIVDDLGIDQLEKYMEKLMVIEVTKMEVVVVHQ